MAREVVVVGAGLSGLVAARALADAGRDVVVLEARDRVGGRTLTRRIAGCDVDVGGQWMSAGQDRLAALAARLGVESYSQLREGEPVVALPELARPGFFARRAMRRLEKMIESPDATSDAISLGAWLARAPAATRAAIAMHAELTFATEPANLSLLHYLHTVAATGGLGGPGEEERRFVGGAQQLCVRLADGLDVRLSTPVRSLDDHPARHVVLAAPPHLARRLVSVPGAERFTSGGVVKLIAAYDRAFWRDDGRSGEAYGAGLVRATVDLTQHDGTPMLLAFVVGEAAAGWARDPAGHQARALAELAALFGPAAAAPVDVITHDWAADPWSAGCVAGLPPGSRTTRWRGPIGHVHLAGTEAADVWPGYLEGAIDAGERAAAEVLGVVSAA